MNEGLRLSGEAPLPEDYYVALYHYSKKLNHDIENEFVRAHAEELVYCFRNQKDFPDFDFWTQYETLLGEKITFEEYRAIEEEFEEYPTEISPEDLKTIGKLRDILTEFRERDPYLFTCLADKGYMFLVKAVDAADAYKTGEKWYARTVFEPGHFSCWNTDKEDYANLDMQDVIESKAYKAKMAALQRENKNNKKPPLAEQILSAGSRQKGIANHAPEKEKDHEPHL